MKKGILIIALVLGFAFSAFAQLENPIIWAYHAKKINKNEAVLMVKATLEEGWHIYSLNLKGFPAKTRFAFSPSTAFSLIGNPTEPTPILKYDKALKLNLTYFEEEVVFTQKIKLNKPSATVKGIVTFVVCNDKGCLPTTEQAFSIPVK